MMYIYNAIVFVGCFGGAGYAVFCHDRSPWWFALAIVVCAIFMFSESKD